MSDGLESLDAFCVTSGDGFDLHSRPTRLPALHIDKGAYRLQLDEHCHTIEQLQRKLFACRRDALLVLVQGMDASGKDGLVREVFRQVDPLGLHAHAFAEPSATELDEDYLRRYQAHLPHRGHISVFNRSYYEHVLTVRVHPSWLGARHLLNQNDVPVGLWHERFAQLRGFENYLQSNRIRVVKLLLHLSCDEQRARFIARLNHPEKAWKLSPADLRDHERWEDFQRAYTDCVAATATPEAPWYVLPADDKRVARLLAARIVRQHLEALAPDWPVLDEQRQRDLDRARKLLENWRSGEA